jgi:anion-transporting  ArsA/GET3 family ATPase
MPDEKGKSDLGPLLTSHRVLVCVGSGGVGKTTLAASLALAGALSGRRAAVVTIDPAKRLADCLGISAGENREQPLPPELFARYGLRPEGTLTALLVDQHGAWDAAIRRYAPTPEIRDQIFANRFYQGLSRTFSGSHEYMAMDTLALLVQGGAYDLIVVDTPPTRQALDFLEAPQRLQRFLDSRARAWFTRAGDARSWSALSAVNRTTAFLLRKIEEATGISALGEISEFFTAMQSMFDDFGERFRRVSQLLTSADTAFLLVTSPEREVLAEAEEFRQGLAQMGISLRAVVANRVHDEWLAAPPDPPDPARLAKRLKNLLLSPAADDFPVGWLVENFLSCRRTAREEATRLARFVDALPAGTPVVRVPALPAFPADLAGLAKMHNYLFPDRQERPPRRAARKRVSLRATTPEKA